MSPFRQSRAMLSFECLNCISVSVEWKSQFRLASRLVTVLQSLTISNKIDYKLLLRSGSVPSNSLSIS